MREALDGFRGNRCLHEARRYASPRSTGRVTRWRAAAVTTRFQSRAGPTAR